MPGALRTPGGGSSPGCRSPKENGDEEEEEEEAMRDSQVRSGCRGALIVASLSLTTGPRGLGRMGGEPSAPLPLLLLRFFCVHPDPPSATLTSLPLHFPLKQGLERSHLGLHHGCRTSRRPQQQ